MLKTVLILASLSLGGQQNYTPKEQAIIDRVKQTACEDGVEQATLDYIQMRVEGKYPVRTNLWLDRIEEDFYQSFEYSPKLNDQKRFSDLYSRQASLCYEQFLELETIYN